MKCLYYKALNVKELLIENTFDIFFKEKLLSLAIEAGMSYETYLNVDEQMVYTYYKAYQNKVDTQAYMNGLYMIEVIGSMFGKIKYPKMPHLRLQEENKKAAKLTENDKDNMYRKKLLKWR